MAASIENFRRNPSEVRGEVFLTKEQYRAHDGCFAAANGDATCEELLHKELTCLPTLFGNDSVTLETILKLV
jgi:hypothetical protein